MFKGRKLLKQTDRPQLIQYDVFNLRPTRKARNIVRVKIAGSLWKGNEGLGLFREIRVLASVVHTFYDMPLASYGFFLLRGNFVDHLFLAAYYLASILQHVSHLAMGRYLVTACNIRYLYKTKLLNLRELEQK